VRNDLGPCFGSGCDIYIKDNCNLIKYYGSNFPRSYGKNENAIDGELTKLNHFTVKRYQVFHLIF
jgi:hypothetical protein